MSDNIQTDTIHRAMTGESGDDRGKRRSGLINRHPFQANMVQ